MANPFPVHARTGLRLVARFAICVTASLPLHAAQRPSAPSAPSSRPTWPSAPSPARVRFIRALSPSAVRKGPTILSKLAVLLAGAAPAPTMAQPYGIAIGRDRLIYVADTVGGVVHVYNVERSQYRTIKVDAASLVGVAVGTDRLFLTDAGTGRLLCLDLKGRRQWILGPKDGLVRPAGLVASTDRLYVVDTGGHRVLMVAFDGRILGAFGERGGGPGQFNFPTNIARSGAGEIYVTDTLNFRVQLFDSDGRFLRAFGQLGDSRGSFERPKGLALDSDGHIYVVEGMGDVVQIFDEDGRLLLSFGGSGTGDGQLWLPSGIAISDDVVYVSDSANRRVEMYEYLKERR